MSSAWPLVALGDVFELKIDAVPVDASATYQIAGVYSFGKGLLARGPLPGTETTYKFFHRLHKDDFVLSQLKAWEGALARVPASFDGWFLSPQFPTFRAKSDRLDIVYVDWYCKQSKVWEQLRSSARGMGDRRDFVSPAKFLSITIPFPTLAEQQRIVARIEELAARIEEARGLRRQAVEEAEALWQASASRVFDKLVENTPLRPLSALVTVKGGGTPSKANPFYWQGPVPWISPKDMKSRELFDAIDHISEEAIANSAAKLIEPGAVLIVVRGMILVHTFPSAILRVPAAINQDMKALIPCAELLTEYLSSLFWAHNSRILDLVEKSTHDTRRLEVSKLLDIKIPVPPIPEQRRIVTYLDNLQAKVDSFKRLQTETSAELDAMLPSILDKAFKGEL